MRSKTAMKVKMAGATVAAVVGFVTLMGCDAAVSPAAVAVPDGGPPDQVGKAGPAETTGPIGTAEQTGDAEQNGDAGQSAPAPVADVKPIGCGQVLAQSGLIMHEWGTFTSVQGSDGSTQDGLQHEEEALPDFVHGRNKLANHLKMAEGLPEPCNQKMETPVVYFYTDKPQDVSLSVQFTNGIISQWFPSVTEMAPKIGALKNNSGVYVSGLSGGSVTWKVRVDPALDMANAPKVPADSVWQPSRQTQATPLHYLGKDTEGQKVDQTERFLFYRGLGRFTLPVQVLNHAKGDMQVVNKSPDALPFAVMLKSTSDGKGGLQVLGAIQANSAVSGVLVPANLPLADVVAQTKQVLKTGLVQSGLYPDEAQAMVDTWQKSWFATPGTRLLYVLPQAWTEKLLPLQMSPAPSERVRTLIGRIESLTQQEESEAQEALKSSKKLGFSVLVSKLDRFLEPRLHRACAQVDPAVYAAHCAEMLAAALHAK